MQMPLEPRISSLSLELETLETQAHSLMLKTSQRIFHSGLPASDKLLYAWLSVHFQSGP